MWSYPLADGSHVEVALNANAGTVAVQRPSLHAPGYGASASRDFSRYIPQLWGDPFDYAVGTVAATLQAPTLSP